MPVPWYLVSGFGAHIKATPRVLVVQRNGRTEEIPLEQVRHLLVMGGHTLHSSVIARLLSAGACISFFEADGEPLGVLRPFGDQADEFVHQAQRGAFAHTFALALARGGAQARILTAVRLQEEWGGPIFFEGELEILEKSLAEMEFMVRLEDIRRIHRLITDMYYEIISRTLPPELNFRRRSPRPRLDVVNTMLSYGYGMLYGNTCVAVIGADLDPDLGFLHKGKGALVYDLIDPFKPAMVDRIVLALARKGLSPEAYECGPSRCILSDSLMERLTESFRAAICQGTIDIQVKVLRDALLKKSEFRVCKPGKDLPTPPGGPR